MPNILKPCLQDPSLEATEGWRDRLESFQERLGTYFARKEAKETAFDYIQILLCRVERKNSWQMAEEARHLNPYRFEHLLGRSVWDAEISR